MARREPQNVLGELGHSDWEKRFLAAKGLTTLEGGKSFAKMSKKSRTAIGGRLQELLDDQDSRVRSQAAAALGNLSVAEAADRLLTAIADPNEWVRIQVAEALGRIGNPSIAQVLAHHLESEEEPHVRATLVKTLGRIGDERMLPVLALYLEDSDARVRANCVESLSDLKISETNLRATFLRLSNDPSNRVRANIAISLLSMGERKGREILATMLSSGSEYMKASAAFAMGQIRDPEDIDTLIRLLADESWLVRKNAIRGLVKFGRKIVPQVMSLLTLAQDPLEKLGALDILGQLGEVSAREIVIGLLEDATGEVRSKAEEVLDLFKSGK